MGILESKPSLYAYTLNELKSLLSPSFRAKQVYHWLYHRYENNIALMDNISKAMQEHLQSHFIISQITPVQIEKSSDGSKKYLFQTKDGHTFESVLIQMKSKELDESGEIVKGENGQCAFLVKLAVRWAVRFALPQRAGLCGI